jgi:hypothetical protein
MDQRSIQGINQSKDLPDWLYQLTRCMAQKGQHKESITQKFIISHVPTKIHCAEDIPLATAEICQTWELHSNGRLKQDVT